MTEFRAIALLLRRLHNTSRCCCCCCYCCSKQQHSTTQNVFFTATAVVVLPSINAVILSSCLSVSLIYIDRNGMKKVSLPLALFSCTTHIASLVWYTAQWDGWLIRHRKREKREIISSQKCLWRRRTARLQKYYHLPQTRVYTLIHRVSEMSQPMSACLNG